MNAALFDLSAIAGFLEGLEESIIFKLLDRAQFCRNLYAYEAGSGGFRAFPDLSIFEARLRFQEEMDARFGRFLVPEERPYLEGLPASERAMKGIPRFPVPSLDVVRQSGAIRAAYDALLDRLCAPGEDGQFGSAVEHDVFALQAIGRRIHYGSFHVAESKYRSDPARYEAMIGLQDRRGLMEALTRREVEERILLRVRDKTQAVQNLVNPRVRRSIDPQVLVDFYRDVIIPLTKEGELAYLLARRQDLA